MSYRTVELEATQSIMCLAMAGNEQSKERGISLSLPFLSSADSIQIGRTGDLRLGAFSKEMVQEHLTFPPVVFL